MLKHEEEVSMATLQVAPTQQKSPWCLEKEGPANRGEMEPPTPSTKLQQLHKKQDNTITKRMQLTKKATPLTAATSMTIQYSTWRQCQRHCG